MGRHRKRREDNRLPPYVYRDRVRWVYRPYTNGRLGKPVRLCALDAPLSEVWAAWEAVTQEKPRESVRWVLDSFLASDTAAGLAVKTRREYRKAAAQLAGAALTDGRVFGDVLAAQVTPGVVRKYLDRNAHRAVAANRELALLSRSYSWALERDLIPGLARNPCKGVRRHSEKARTRYVTPAEYRAVYDLAHGYLRPAMELAYLCRARISEVLDLRLDDLLDEGVRIRRLKGSRTQVVAWSTRLRAAVREARALHGVGSMFVLHDRRGQKLRYDAFSTAWQRVMARALAEGLVSHRFSFHDLKAAGVSDFDGDKRKAAGHRTLAMVNVYDRKIEVVEATE